MQVPLPPLPRFVLAERLLYGLANIFVPLFSVWSDMTVSKYGKRRPWLLFGSLVMLAFCGAMYASSIQKSPTWFLVSLGFGLVGKNIILGTANLLLIDLVPPRLTDTISLYCTAFAALGVIFGFLYQIFFVDVPVPFVYLVYILVYMTVLWMALSVLREPVATEKSVLLPERADGRTGGVLTIYLMIWEAFVISTDYMLFTLARIFFCASTAGLSLLLYFFRDVYLWEEDHSRQLLGKAALGAQLLVVLLSLALLSRDRMRRGAGSAHIHRFRWVLGTAACGLATTMCICMDGRDKEGLKEGAVYIGAACYGIGITFVGAAEVALMLELRY